MAQWDFVRITLQFLVLANHIDGLMYVDHTPDRSYFVFGPSGFKMPAFIFVSGVFGSSMKLDSITKMLCYTAGAGFFVNMLIETIVNLPPKNIGTVNFQTWYLVVLCACRLTITPLFHLARSLRVHVALPLATVVVACYGGRAITGRCLTSGRVSGDALMDEVCDAHNAFNELTFFAPFFALGLVASIKQWTELVNDRRFVCFSVASFVAWYAAIAMSPAFREWNDAACLGTQQCDTAHWPMSVQGPFDMGMATFLNWLRVLGLKTFITLAAIGTLAAMVAPLQRVAPRFMDVFLSLGARTIFSYLLHYPLFILLGQKMYADVLLQQVSAAAWPTVCVIIAVVETLVWCSSLTGLIFRWMILPYWLRSPWESCCELKRAASPLAN